MKDPSTCLDDRNHKLGRVRELGHVDIEMAQVVLLSLFQYDTAPLSHGVDAAKIACRIMARVGCFGKGDIGQSRILRRVALSSLHGEDSPRGAALFTCGQVAAPAAPFAREEIEAGHGW